MLLQTRQGKFDKAALLTRCDEAVAALPLPTVPCLDLKIDKCLGFK